VITPISNSQILIQQNTFENFELFTQVTNAWDLDFCQLDRGKTHVNLLQFVSSQFNFVCAQLNRHYHQRGSAPAGMRTFAIIEENVQGLTWFGKPVTSSSLMCFPVFRELESVSSNSWSTLPTNCVYRRSSAYYAAKPAFDPAMPYLCSRH
jgi:hypothetical protein